MKRANRLPDVSDFGIKVESIRCPFCESADVAFDSMTGGAANELLMRCMACKSFFFTLKDPAFLEINSPEHNQSGQKRS